MSKKYTKELKAEAIKLVTDHGYSEVAAAKNLEINVKNMSRWASKQNQQAPSPLLVLIDGSSYLHRAYHALPQLANAYGEPTGAVYGVINMIRKLLHDYHPEYIAVIFDAKGKNFRHEIYPAYKANRPAMEDDLRVQIKPLHDIITAMGLPLLSIAGVEADDVIATLAHRATQIGVRVLISTSDKDLVQLVDDNVTLINTMNNTVLDNNGVVAKFGVTPAQIVDYLTLVGDSSDNIPGVPMIGPKTAVKLLKEHGSLDTIIQQTHTVKGKVGENLRCSIPKLPLTRKLVTVNTDVKLDCDIQDLTHRQPDTEKLIALFQRLEFRTWLKSLLHENQEQHHNQYQKGHNQNSELPKQPPHHITTNYQLILDEPTFLNYVKKLSGATSFALDIETNNLDIINAKIVGISFAIKIGEAVYIPLAHDYEGAPKQLNTGYVLQHLKPILQNPYQSKLGQNLKFDMSILANHHLKLQGVSFDTMLASYVLNSSSNHHDKETLVLKYLGKTLTTFAALTDQKNADKTNQNAAKNKAKNDDNHQSITTKESSNDEDQSNNQEDEIENKTKKNTKGNKLLTFNQVRLEQAAPYAAADADLVLQLHEVLAQELELYPKLNTVLQNIEIPLLGVLSRMECCGVKIDDALLSQQSSAIAAKLKIIAATIYEIAGTVFNLNSPQQLQEILFDKLQLPILHKTPKGQPSTAEPTLQELALEYPLPRLILEYRSLNKLKSTYTDSLPGQINPTTGRIHTSYNQTITSTGRLSSTNPNLQNIPIRTEEGRRIRQAFIAPNANYKIISADYSQIELRIMAHLSRDPGLLRAFTTDINGDIHRATAAEVFGVAPDQITAVQRQRAKTINFGLIYGMSAFGLAKRLGLSHEAASGYVDIYFKHYPGVKEYMEQTKLTAQQLGYVETIFGRRIYLPNIKAKNFQLRSAAERAAINAPMQGSAADMMKIAMINLDRWISNISSINDHENSTENRENSLDIKMIMQVHDELVFEVAKHDVEAAITKIKHGMENATTMRGHADNINVEHIAQPAAQLKFAVPIVVQIGVGDNWDEAH